VQWPTQFQKLTGTVTFDAMATSLALNDYRRPARVRPLATAQRTGADRW